MNALKILFSILVIGGALVTFFTAVGVVMLYAWIVRDEDGPEDFECDYDTAVAADRVRHAAFVPKARPPYPRQTVADVVTFNAYRAARKRGGAA